MPEPHPRLALLTPHAVAAERADELCAALEQAGAAGDVAAVILRLAAGDERSLINLVKRIAPVVQAHEAALVVSCAGFTGDLAAVVARGGADGVHLERADAAALQDLRPRLRDGRILGAGGVLESRHAAMAAGETGADYLLFGGSYPDGVLPDAEVVRERAQWWAEIFETPCIAVAGQADEVAALAATGAEFVGLEADLWLAAPEAVERAQADLMRAGAPA